MLSEEEVQEARAWVIQNRIERNKEFEDQDQFWKTDNR